jgi:tetratricopeptide (TPR) repeat protein
MNDLSGLDWSAESGDKKKAAVPNASYTFANLRPTPPLSGRTTPLNAPTSNPSSKPTTPANDSFANLVSFNNSNTNKNLSLQERQKQLANEKKKQTLGSGSPFNGVDEKIWESLGSGRSTPAPSNGVSGSGSNARQTKEQIPTKDEDDVLAAFNKSIPTANNGLLHETFDDDDDPFGLNQLKSPAPTSALPPPTQLDVDDDDDVLGLLAKPADSMPKSAPRKESEPETLAFSHPQAKAVAELVDMGFPADKARHALETTDSGTDVQAAVGYLLNQAHSESRQRTKPKNDGREAELGTNINPDRSRMRDADRHRLEARARRQETSNASQAEKAPGEVAAELSTKFLKTAGTFWKQSTKKLQQAVEEFNSDSDSSQPKWMREPERAPSERRTQTREDEAGVARRRRRSSAAKKEASVTDEAMMLEIARPEPRRPARSRFDDSSADTSRDHSPAFRSRLRETTPAKPAFLRPQHPSAPPPKQGLSRAAIEEQASQAYVSSAQRRKAPVAPPVSTSEPDLLNSTARALPSRSATSRPSQPAKRSAPIAVRPAAPPRAIPPVSSIALKSSHFHREEGNAHFKRGDYSAAHVSYSTALSHLPQNHPITIILLTNRSLTSLKVGEPKTALSAADSAIALAGPAKGEGEFVDLGTGDQPKPMREYYGKALMRKAEALEQMERWTDAASVWREAVEGGHGGATSIQGRARAERAANPPAKTPITRKTASVPARMPATISQKNSAAAVQALRAANAAAEKADDEKFALSDKIDAKLAAWKGSKADNLRALLGSLDIVLWPEAGWKKISMADLVLPNKVKIQYMKGIAKVHPDKIPTTATTEQRMIAGAVFSTLNEAWDKFKTDNGL